ncbi:MAG TPA: SH3 domain-containing protein [Casimicrobiaceae bacterium]|jgi:SH3-like domain-containing protein|nr:SH3 domain-containing protein [Casimicrobiaceae bacterium]
MARAALAWLLLFVAAPLAAAEYRATAEPATVLYDAPSAKAKPMFVYGRDVPVEVLVGVEGWTKIRDSSGTIGWMPSKSLAEKRVVVVRPPVADVRASPEENAPVVFRAEQNVILDVAETAASPSAVAAPGWVHVRHRDGASGYIRLSQVFGF